MAQNFIAEIVSNVEVAEKIFKLTVEAAACRNFAGRSIGEHVILSRRNG